MKLLNRIRCWFGFHDFFVIQRLTAWSRRMGCKHCTNTWCMSNNRQYVVPWDDDLEMMYRDVLEVELIPIEKDMK